MRLLLGDCLDKLKELEDNSVDSIVTDPPYGLSFMGKKWDYDVPTQEIWQECLRVLKHGGHLLAFAGSRTYHRMVVRIEDAGFEIRDQIMWIYGSGFPKSHNIGHKIDDYKGWGTALKPAHEPIVMARKPLSEKTVVENVLEWGTGGINIDDSRIETDDNLNGGAYAKNPTERETMWGEDAKNSWKRGGAGEFEQPQGRFPANVIFDEEAGKTLDEQTGIIKTGDIKPYKSNTTSSIYGDSGFFKNTDVKTTNFKGDSGGASRFFYCPKTSKKDRGDGNIHPTVKPTDLMLYLIRLVTPKDGITLDPFMGSGSTGKAALKGGFDFIGIEREQEYFDIAKARIDYENNNLFKK